MAPVLILLTFLLPLGAGAEEIIGGFVVKPHSYPYMALIASVHDDENRSRCGGFLVKDNFVLTAAHCKGSSMNVTLGAHNIKIKEETQQIFPVAKAIHHLDFNPEHITNDIMLLKLERKAKRTEAGDAGGLLLCKKAAAGIVYFGYINNSTLRIFTRVSHFLSWIKEVMIHS